VNHSPKSDLIDSHRNSFRLGSELGKGGEGWVFEVSSDPKLAAKVYHTHLKAEKADKIRLMASVQNDQIVSVAAWPLDLLSTSSGDPVGFIMPKIDGRKDIHQLYSPKSRRVEFQRADWRFLIRAAANTARAFSAVHNLGCIIGDVNHGSILVGQDATVRLIDCDSFQIISGARRFLCEVGVETFTPPELQGKSFKGIIRTANHDHFGLAVLIFLVLFMGRHPFSGRYQGSEDMPISRAIEQFRFAYGANRHAFKMEQPPGTPPLSIAGSELVALFERSFSQGAVNGGRPNAEEWSIALEQIEKKLRQCASNSSHWYGNFEAACPWCRMEGTTGVSLFPIVLQAQPSFFDINVLWRQVEALESPGPAPRFEELIVPPKKEAAAVRSRKTAKYWLSGIIAGSLITAALFAPIENGKVFLFFAGIAAFFVLRNVIDKSDEIQSYRRVLEDKKDKWIKAEKLWTARLGPAEFETKKAAIVRLKGEWQDLPNQHLRKLDQLRQDQRKYQLEHFLDSFWLDQAAIEGIGPGRKRTLESYGIETAADMISQKILKVPGFGRKMESKLLAWRASIEKQFVFDPNKPVDAQDIAGVEQEILARRQKLELNLQAMAVELGQIRQRIVAGREHIKLQMEAVRLGYAQAQADYKAASGQKG
jgi:DNA-binding helix-hairpin-helix protein with protein kinase domain